MCNNIKAIHNTGHAHGNRSKLSEAELTNVHNGCKINFYRSQLVDTCYMSIQHYHQIIGDARWIKQGRDKEVN